MHQIDTEANAWRFMHDLCSNETPILMSCFSASKWYRCMRSIAASVTMLTIDEENEWVRTWPLIHSMPKSVSDNEERHEKSQSSMTQLARSNRKRPLIFIHSFIHWFPPFSTHPFFFFSETSNAYAAVISIRCSFSYSWTFFTSDVCSFISTDELFIMKNSHNQPTGWFWRIKSCWLLCSERFLEKRELRMSYTWRKTIGSFTCIVPVVVRDPGAKKENKDKW